MSFDPRPILVVGATGTTGGAVLAELRAAGAPVRAMTRRPDAAEQLRQNGVDAVVADLGDPQSLQPAVEGVRAVYVVEGATPQMAEHEGALATAAVAAGVELLVKLSVVGAAPDGPIRFARVHGDAEQAVRAAGVPWTFVRPNGFMQNTLSWAGQLAGGTVHAPVLDARWSIVDVRDVAAVAVAALLDPGTFAGRTPVVTGAEPLSTGEEIAIVGEVLGRPVEAQETTVEQTLDVLRGYGLPQWALEGLAELWELYARGDAQEVSDDVERITGRPPRSFREFAEDHRAAFAG